jgi:hypothetical protein
MDTQTLESQNLCKNCRYCNQAKLMAIKRLIKRKNCTKCILCNRQYNYPSCLILHIKSFHFPDL